MPRHIAALGAYDRFNYGDLLFPLIVKRYFGSCQPAPSIDFYALNKSDFSTFGGVPTGSMRAMLKDPKLAEGGVILFSGGGLIGADWYSMHADLLSVTGARALYYLSRLLGDRRANQLSRFYFGGAGEFPWVLEPSDVRGAVDVIYNAVGGSELGQLPTPAREATFRKLSTATYLSVRDARTREVLEPVAHEIDVHVAPDSAVIVSELFPIGWLESQVRPELKKLIDDTGPYLCFQCNKVYGALRLTEIREQIEAICHEYGLGCIFLPIGRYSNLQDQFAVAEIQRGLGIATKMVGADATIWEIMYALAKAAVFVGTSLHGLITSQSFAVPHIGLFERPGKVEYYLKTWDLEEQAVSSPIGELCVRVGEVLAIERARLEEKRVELISLSIDNFGRMASAIGLQSHKSLFNPVRST